jgi:hypothetical protein
MAVENPTQEPSQFDLHANLFSLGAIQLTKRCAENRMELAS